MGKTLIFGHKNPDTDTITAAIAHAHLKNELGEEAEAVRLGDVNGETQYALDYFNVEAPRFIEAAATETDKVILVDHNEKQQSVDDLEKVQILEVIDHHRIANFQTKDPLYYRAEPVGCTATILNKLYKENDVKIPKEIAGLMVSAIISDSLLFKSPTCTDQDKAAAEELAKLAGINLNEYGLAMLKAGADISDKTVEDLLSLDAKEFDMNGHKVEVAQVNTVDVNDVLKNKQAINDATAKVIDERGLSLFLFVITDILENNSVIIANGEQINTVEKAFDISLEDKQGLLRGVVSRKKQIVPQLTEAFTN
ncbi:manganese-dependent inorganic pyrophosphatase [Saliterribacillus persicus]|uniref:Probable manganese-dependent inorganic pyrophosphatase n=1 Tax=Saliterribacillus persicus TaxID=930114 RepID=A0A368X7G2_9BACI|nr:manganese-dependent inorganic pyrophosphatase [Saliterribacillus persicus]RCW63755.1 manganese-dependent inorganic pyrophosphatase [Saliterribacillus persicus]